MSCNPATCVPWLAFVHTTMWLVAVTYLYWGNPRLDKLYMGFAFFGLCLSWLIFLDECIVSLLYKYALAPSYVAGAASLNMTDLTGCYASAFGTCAGYPALLVAFGALLVVNVAVVAARMPAFGGAWAALFSVSTVLYSARVRMGYPPGSLQAIVCNGGFGAILIAGLVRMAAC